MFADDAPVVPSGFHIIPLGSKSGDVKEALTSHRTLDLTSSLEFPFENNLADNVATMARQYVHSVISAVQRVAMSISPSGLSPSLGPKLSVGSPEALTVAHRICESYSYHLGADLLRSDSTGGDSLLKNHWHHLDAILCCSWKSLPVFIFANQEGLDSLCMTKCLFSHCKINFADLLILSVFMSIAVEVAGFCCQIWPHTS